MKLELQCSGKDKSLLMKDLKAGDIGIVLCGVVPVPENYVNDIFKIVEILGELFAVELNGDSYWTDLPKNDLEVRLLEPGETLVVQ